MQRIYVAIQIEIVAGGIEFDWDAGNARHLAAHKVTAVEFGQLMSNDPLDLDYEMIDGEVRYRSVGVTNRGRVLTAVWTIRDGRIRAVTSFQAGAADKRAFLEKTS